MPCSITRIKTESKLLRYLRCDWLSSCRLDWCNCHTIFAIFLHANILALWFTVDGNDLLARAAFYFYGTINQYAFEQEFIIVGAAVLFVIGIHTAE